jgi:protein transport protein DSL1/ZW10
MSNYVLVRNRLMALQNSIGISKVAADHTIKSLFHDMEDIIYFLANNLPPDLIKPLSQAMMPIISTRITEVWLDTAVPSSLDDMINYQKALALVDDFAAKLKSLEWPGVDSFNDWVSNAPKIWLAKRRESSLDWVRNELSLGAYSYFMFLISNMGQGQPRFHYRLSMI